MKPQGEATVPLGPEWAREARRQQALLRVLFAATAPDKLPRALGLRRSEVQVKAGLAAYRANAAAHADTALAAAYPTVRAMLGSDAFGAVAVRHWHRRPPRRGDLAWAGEGFASTLAAEPTLRDWPWLADCARLDRARWEVQFDAPAAFGAAHLNLLRDADPAALILHLAPATRLVAFRWPAHALWQAHASAEPQAAELRAALNGGPQTVWVWCIGWTVGQRCVDAGEARWLRALSARKTLAAAMDAAPADFDVAAWLQTAVTHGWLGGVSLVDARATTTKRRA